MLQFQAELAVAHGAVATELPDEWAEQHGYLSLRSRVGSHREFLLRPDLGRRLDDASVQRLRTQAKHGVHVQPILADGLSAVACMGAGPELLERFTAGCVARGWTVGTPMAAKFARVWLEDEIGQEVRAKVAVILLGERPGLGTGDGLSAYLVYDPKLGNTDGNRNMMSNIHARGTPPTEAALVPPPRANTIIYSGVLAGHAAWRAEVVPKVPTSTDAEKKARDARKLKRRDGPEPSFRAQNALSWADLLQRVFRVNGWECPHCHKAMSLRTVVIGVPECTRILHGLQNSTGPPAEA